ncbi:MAG: helix-turn-helix domain-containing protein [Deltaproteobacteria bacterium]|jgi:hypothetical protein|nr:helix-turn-helix domain-containing protein [Deltaproteobacteria bacterium]
MPKLQLSQNAEDYLAFHELDLQNSSDLVGNKIVEASIPNEAVRRTRIALGLNLDMMAILLGVNLSSMIRYENISLPNYPQGPVARKMGLLINWLADPKSKGDILNLLGRDNGLATLSGLLQTESVMTFMHLSSLKELSEDENKAFTGDPGQVVGNA